MFQGYNDVMLALNVLLKSRPTFCLDFEAKDPLAPTWRTYPFPPETGPKNKKENKHDRMGLL